MNNTIRRLKQQIEQRGGRIHIDESLPDAVTERFLKEVLTCPDCLAQARTNSLAQSGDRRPRSSGH